MDLSVPHGIDLTETSESDEDLISLTHFLHPELYAQAEQEAPEAKAGPLPYGAVEVYYARLYGTYMTIWRNALGHVLYYAALMRTAAALQRDVSLIRTRDISTEHVLVPLMTHFIAAVFHTVMTEDSTPRTIHLALAGFHQYLEAIVLDEELCYLTVPLLDVIKELGAAKGIFTDEERSHWCGRFYQAVHHYHLAIPDMVKLLQTSECRGNDEVTGMHSPSCRIALEEGSIKPLPSPTLLPTVCQLDGSHALSAEEALREIILRHRPRLEDVESQLADSLAQSEAPYTEALALWWKVSRSRGNEKALYAEARCLDNVGRCLKALWSPTQFTTMVGFLPAEEVVNQVISFIRGVESDVPDMSWAQLRISLLAMTMGRMAYIGKTDAIGYAVSLYEAMGLHDEIPLLKATMGVHAEAMEASIKLSLEAISYQTKQ